jgi:geranylgeranyl reductase family protein
MDFGRIAISSADPPVLVVGAGPAGATAARTLALAGVPVRMIDRARFPRNKPCGGGISIRVLRRFPYLEPELPRIAAHTLSRLYLEGPDGESALVTSDAPAALMIRRVEFDELLVTLATRAGAELEYGDIVQAVDECGVIRLTTRDGRSFRSRTVIAADGVNSIVARRLGFYQRWPARSVALDMMEETPRDVLRDVDPSTLWVAYGYGNGASRLARDRRVPEGYAYIFPKRDHVNVGIGYVLSYFRESVDAAPYDLQRAFVGRLVERGILRGTSERSNFTPFLIPVGGPLRNPGRGRVLLAGDAGGFVNAFTAEGIYYAMVSGELAARAIISTSLPTNVSTSPSSTPSSNFSDPAAVYKHACRREIGAELRDSVLIQRYLFADSRRIARIVRNAVDDSPITKLILDYALGRRSYQSVRRRVLARAPHLALSLMAEFLRGCH